MLFSQRPLVPGNLCVACFLEETRFPLQSDRLSDCPTLLLMHLLTTTEHVLVGVMVDLGVHYFPPGTILDEGAETWELVSPFLVILGTSNCFVF